MTIEHVRSFENSPIFRVPTTWLTRFDYKCFQLFSNPVTLSAILLKATSHTHHVFTIQPITATV